MTFSPGAHITLYAMLGESEVALPGRVVPMPAGSGFGFSIDMEQLGEGAREQLEAYIKARSES